MSVFVDTSGLLAVLDFDDANHESADEAWRELLKTDEPLVTSNYVLVEAFALVQSRLGMTAIQALSRDAIPLLKVHWVGEAEHSAATAALLSAGRRRLSLVDCSSFEVMRALGIDRCFAFDPHFREQGFKCLP